MDLRLEIKNRLALFQSSFRNRKVNFDQDEGTVINDISHGVAKTNEKLKHWQVQIQQ